MGKTFTTAPRPGSLEAIEAYERGGPGHDTTKPRANISAYPQAHEPVKAQINVSTYPQPQEPVAAQASIPTDPQTHIPAKAPEPMKRLSIDMPESLHWRFKVACVTAKKLMVEEVLAFIKRRTAELEKG
ncbi:MAG TPA: hypothetical protein VNA86_06310 [bacterium]|nr:hypothetical protein [bacterium]